MKNIYFNNAMAEWIKNNNKGIHIFLHVIPNAKKSEIIGNYNNRLKIKISSPPVDGSANKEIIKFFSKLLKTSKNNIKIIKGENSREKELFIANIDKDYIQNILEG
jgi:uncharacterized protein (TIGR00251 family)